jgi:hypothetical protein
MELPFGATAFKTRYVEFEDLNDSFIEAVIAQAALIWRNTEGHLLFESIVMAQVALDIASTHNGFGAKIAAGVATIYGQKLESLAARVRIGFMAL